MESIISATAFIWLFDSKVASLSCRPTLKNKYYCKYDRILSLCTTTNWCYNLATIQHDHTRSSNVIVFNLILIQPLSNIHEHTVCTKT